MKPSGAGGRRCTVASSREGRPQLSGLRAGHRVRPASRFSGIRDPFGPIARRSATVGAKEICTSIIVASELRYGCAKKGSPKFHAKVEDLLRVMPVPPLDIPADVDYGGIRAELEAAGLPIGANDLLIAAYGQSQNLTLVTHNTREFARIRGLNLENRIEGPHRRGGVVWCALGVGASGARMSRRHWSGGSPRWPLPRRAGES